LKKKEYVIQGGTHHDQCPATGSKQLMMLPLTPSDICSFLVLCQVQALVDLWTSNGKSVVEKLKQRSLAPKQVTNREPVPVRQI